jgi:hypothetical protein
MKGESRGLQEIKEPTSINLRRSASERLKQPQTANCIPVTLQDDMIIHGSFLLPSTKLPFFLFFVLSDDDDLDADRQP